MSQDTAICPASDKPYVGRRERNGRCIRTRFTLIDMIGESYQPQVHFVGFRGEEYHSAVKAFGLLDVYHRTWDQRAQQRSRYATQSYSLRE